MLNKSIAYRLSIYISGAVIGVFIIFMVIFYTVNSRNIVESLTNKAIGESNRVIMQIEKQLVATREITSNISDQIIFYGQHQHPELFVTNLLKKYPYIKEFHKPAFSVSKFLFEHGSLPDPLFDSCPGTKTEWAFDYTGKIYSCTATVGKSGEELGTFYPGISLNDDAVSEWEERDVLSIDKCRSCELQLACGGGCASVAKNNTGMINAPDCRPIKKLLELGIGHYFSS